jgi:hypothetical protein
MEVIATRSAIRAESDVSSDDSSDDNISLLLLALIAAQRARHRRRRRVPRPRFIPISGSISQPDARFVEVLQTHQRCWDTLGCSISTFSALTEWVSPQLGSRRPQTVSREETVAMFLYICRHASGHRNCETFFARSSRTVSRAFNSVLQALVVLHEDVVQEPTVMSPVPWKIANNAKFVAFRDCVGAIDGTHIAAHVPATKNGQPVNQKPWLNRKGYLSQNVAACCDFDLRFVFIHAGYEGSAHDSKVIKDALVKKRFHPPPGRYYLADAGYYHSDYLLKPYNSTRYHLREWNEPGASRPRTKAELFNLRHSQLRNHIERIFGVLKRKFKILSVPPQYSLPQQRDLVIALTAIFNFIAERDRQADPDFAEAVPLTDSSLPSFESYSPTAEAARKRMEAKRDLIADEMWTQYTEILQRREQARNIAIFLADN